MYKSLQPPQGFINIDIPRFPSDGKYEGPLPQQWPCPSHGIKRSLAWMLRVNGAHGPLPHRWRGGFFGNRVHSQHQVQSSSVEHPEQQLDRPQQQVRDLPILRFSPFVRDTLGCRVGWKMKCLCRWFRSMQSRSVASNLQGTRNSSAAKLSWCVHCKRIAGSS